MWNTSVKNENEARKRGGKRGRSENNKGIGDEIWVELTG